MEGDDTAMISKESFRELKAALSLQLQLDDPS